MLNKYIAIGNLTQNPATKKVGEYSVTNFGLAINDVVLKNKEKQKQVTFIDVETWGKQAENCSKYLEKGRRVLVEGKIKMNAWEKDGKKFSKLFCVADKVTFLNGESQNGQDSGDVQSGSYDTKPSKKSIEEKETVENSEDEYNIDDIPF